MLRKYIFSVLFIIGFYSSHAQKISVHANVLVSDLYVLTEQVSINWPDNQYKYKLGFSVGVSSEYNIFNSEKISLAPMLQFLSVGANEEFIDDDFNWFVDSTPDFRLEPINIYYLSMPFSLYYQINKLMTVHMGPQLGYRLNNEIKVKSFVRKSFDKRFDYGLLLGLRFRIVEKTHTQIDFYNGFGNVEYIQYSGTPDNRKARNRYLSWGLSYQL